MYHLYVLKCADKTLYTGITTEVKRRVREHNTGKLGAKYTRARRPVTLVYAKKYKSRGAALKAEAKLKAMPRAEKLILIQQTS